MATTRTIRVEGLRELNRALAKLNRTLYRRVNSELKDAAEPVRIAAEQKAMDGIRNIGPVWGTMRVGATRKMVYVAPTARNRGGSPRPNLGTLLMQRAMLPALDEHQQEVVHRLEGVLDRMGREVGF